MLKDDLGAFEEMLKIKELGIRGEKHFVSAVSIHDTDGRKISTSAEIYNVGFDGFTSGKLRQNSIKSAKVDNSFQATLERLQNVGKKLEVWLAEELAAQQFSSRPSRKDALGQSFQAAGDNTSATAVASGQASQGISFPAPFLPYSINLNAENHTAWRSSMSHGLSPDFQLPMDESTARCNALPDNCCLANKLTYPCRSMSTVEERSEEQDMKGKYFGRHDEAESSLASLSPVTSMPTSATITPRGKQVPSAIWIYWN